MAYAEQHNIPIEMKRGKKSPFSMDANLLHISLGGPLEDPFTEPPAEMWRWSVSPEMAPNEATYLDLTYEKGDIVAIDGKAMTPAEVLTELNRLGGENGIGRLDIVENRFVGMKSRGAYETRAAPSCCGPTGRSSRSRSTVKSRTSRIRSCRSTPS